MNGMTPTKLISPRTIVLTEFGLYEVAFFPELASIINGLRPGHIVCSVIAIDRKDDTSWQRHEFSHMGQFFCSAAIVLEEDGCRVHSSVCQPVDESSGAVWRYNADAIRAEVAHRAKTAAEAAREHMPLIIEGWQPMRKCFNAPF
jgi:hypothetical protein